MKPGTHTENVDYFAGQLTADPFEGVDSSIPLQFGQATFTPNDPPGIHRIANMAHYRGLLLSVHFVTETWGTLEGSAVMVAPGIAITATHVVQDYKSLIIEKGLRTICIGYTPSGFQAWRVRYVTPVGTLDGRTDLTVLSLELASAIPPDRAFTQAVMTTRRPQIGEQIMVVGFRASNQHVPYDEHHAFDIVDGNIRYGSDIFASVGAVRNYHPDGRRPMSSGPMLEVECSTPGGLSGGPVFDIYGRVFGVLCSSINGAPPISYVSCLWPAIGQPITPAFLEGRLPEHFCLLDLPPEICGIEGRELLKITRDPSSELIAVSLADCRTITSDEVQTAETVKESKGSKLDAKKRAEYHSEVARAEDWDTSAWPRWTVTGRVLPERCDVRIANVRSQGVGALGRFQLTLEVMRSHIVAVCALEKGNPSVFEIADVVRSALR